MSKETSGNGDDWQPRRRALARGRLAEALCAWRLRLVGYRILARNWRCPAGEIDILARRGDLLAVVEVKARADLDRAAAALGPVQRRRIARAAEWWLARHPGPERIRFDVMLVAPGRWPRHCRDAWTP